MDEMDGQCDSLSVNLREPSCRGAESIWRYIVSPIRRRYGGPQPWVRGLS
jgi:hypothetical protein